MAKTNLSKILITGSFYGKRDCPDNPKKKGWHAFDDVSSVKTAVPGERLVTSVCRYCGGIIKDCPSVSA